MLYKINYNSMEKDTAKSPVRVSVSEAGRLFGVTQTTIRQAIKTQELRYIVVRGRYKINFESLINWSQKNTRRKIKLEKDGLGQYVEKWRIKNKLFSPGQESLANNKLID